MTSFSLIATCAICSTGFEAHTSYGLCPSCISRDRLREFDRLQSAKRHAERARLPVSLTLLQWLGTISDFHGLCAYCQTIPYSAIGMVNLVEGLVWENIVPVCKACNVHRQHSFDAAVARVQTYLQGAQHNETELHTRLTESFEALEPWEDLLELRGET